VNDAPTPELPSIEQTEDNPPVPNPTQGYLLGDNFDKDTVTNPVVSDGFVSGITATGGFGDSQAFGVALKNGTGNQNVKHTFEKPIKAEGASEVWMYIDTQGTNFAKIWPGLVKGGKTFTTDDLDNQTDMYYYMLLDNKYWVKKSFDSDGCIANLNFKGWIRIPVENFANGSTKLIADGAITDFTCGMKPDASSDYTGKTYIFDEIAFSGLNLVKGTSRVSDFLTAKNIPTDLVPEAKEGFVTVMDYENVKIVGSPLTIEDNVGLHDDCKGGIDAGAVEYSVESG
ncbi:MAG: hypothetical protein RR483_02145, partial [Clostridia bacterium]